MVLYGLVSSDVADSSSKSTIHGILNLPFNGVFQKVAPSLPDSLLPQSEIRNLSFMTKEIQRVISNQALEFKFFEEILLEQLEDRSLPPGPAVVDAIFAWESSDGRMELCRYADDDGSLFYSGTSSRPILRNADVKAVANVQGGPDFAVAALDRRLFGTNQSHNSSIFNDAGRLVQTIPTDYPLDVAAFTLPGAENNSSRRPCYIFAEGMARNSSVYCRASDGISYELFQQLPTVDARLVGC